MNINPTRPPQKIRSLVWVALVAAIGSACGAAVAQTQTAPAAMSSVGATGLSLKEATQLAVLSNPEVLARWHTIKAAHGERDAARGALFPRLDLSLAKGRERGDLGNGNRSAVSLSLTQLLYDGFATRNEIERLDHASRVRLYEFFDMSEAVALEAVRAYVDVLRYRELVRLAEDNYVEHRAVFSLTDQRVQAKVAPSVDLEQVRGRLALAESNVLTESANLHDTTARFQRIIGRLPGGPLALPPYLTQDIPGDANTALVRVQERHGALLAAIENVRASNSALASRKGAFGPRVDFRLRKEQGTSLSTSANASANATAAEVLLTWNLFNGFGDTARERQFAEQVNVAMDLRDKVCRDTRQTLVIAYNDVNKLKEQFDFLMLHEGSTSRALTAYRLQFSIGQRTLLSLLDTENELFQARRAVAHARHDLHFAYARTQAGLGNLLRALELTSLHTDAVAEQLPAVGPGEMPAECPPEPVGVYVSNKPELIERAAQLSRRSLPVARDAASAAVPTAISSTAASASAAAVPAAVAPQPGAKAVYDALEVWRGAWTQRDLASYFGTYAPGISPARSLSREAWEAGRRSVIGRAKDVSLVLEDVAVQLRDATHATAVFKQVYRSAGYRDEVTKTLRWERLRDRWFIVEESAVAPR